MISIQQVAQHWREAIDRLFGLPNYERYLQHHQAQHADQPALSRREFYAQAEQHRYGRNGTKKCC
jgi:uncharacterized short protein YbdD (DUF466 family)